VKSSSEALVEQLQKVSTAAYQAAASAAGPKDGGPASGDGDQPGESGESSDQGNEEVVEGEYKEA